MQTAGMLRGTRAICLLVLLVPLIGISHSLPLQLLPSIPGYIPVYIRNGDQPLEEINPALAEAFHETSGSSKSIRLDNAPVWVDLNPVEDEANTSVGKSKKKSNYPVHVRQVESGDAENGRVKDDKDEDKKRPDNNSRVTDVPKLLSIYELQGDDEVKKVSNPKPPIMKTSKPLPLPTDEHAEKGAEKDDTKDDAKDDTKSHETHDENPNFPELPAEVPQRHDEVARAFSTNKIETTVAGESITLPTIKLIKDLSQPIVQNDDTPVSTTDSEEPPVKMRNLPAILANVQKVLPPPTVAEPTNGQSGPTPMEGIAEQEEDGTKDLTGKNDDVPSF